MIKSLAAISIILLGVFVSAEAQTARTNIEIVNDLIEMSIGRADSAIGSAPRNIQLDFIAPGDYSVLKSRIMNALSNKNFTLVPQAGPEDLRLSYTLDEVKVKYPDAFRKSFLGDIYLSREISLKGSFYIGDARHIENPRKFEFSATDTVSYDSVSEIENRAIPFTAGEIPAEPFPGILLEPVIAVGTLIVAVILLFTVRSK